MKFKKIFFILHFSVECGIFKVSQNEGPIQKATIGTFSGGPLFGWIWEGNKQPKIINLRKAQFPSKIHLFTSDKHTKTLS